MNEQFYENIIDSLPYAFLVLDNELSVIRCNKSCETLFSMTKEEILGSNLSQIIPHRELQSQAQAVLQNGGTKLVELHLDDEIPKILKAIATALGVAGHDESALCLITLEDISERERLEGYQAAPAKHDLTMDPEIVISEAGPFSKEHYREYIGSLLERRDKYTAIFAGHDRIAQLIYSAAQDLGLDIPGDISLVGYDDLPFTTFSLTTMLQPIYELGRESLKLILSRIRGENSEPQRIVLKSNLVERSSAKALK